MKKGVRAESVGMAQRLCSFGSMIVRFGSTNVMSYSGRAHIPCPSCVAPGALARVRASLGRCGGRWRAVGGRSGTCTAGGLAGLVAAVGAPRYVTREGAGGLSAFGQAQGAAPAVSQVGAWPRASVCRRRGGQ